jgi:ATP-dependent RNA helicase RhlB
VRQQVFFPAKEEKIPLLLNLLERTGASRSIVFVNTKAAAERVSTRLARQGHKVATLSGDVPQKKRQTLLQRFQSGQLELLIATDVAARGLHIPDVSHVFNYDLPQDPEDYVHRIGRTARLGAAGDAISFACDLYAMALPDIEGYIGQKIPVQAIDASLLVAPPPRGPALPSALHEDDGEATGETPSASASSPRSRRRRRGGGRHGGHPATSSAGNAP